jgi:hypothetical protein
VTKRAHHFGTAFCEDPKCGLHITGYDANDRPICEIVMSRDTTLELMQICKDVLYEKATWDDDTRPIRPS